GRSGSGSARCARAVRRLHKRQRRRGSFRSAWRNPVIGRTMASMGDADCRENLTNVQLTLPNSGTILMDRLDELAIFVRIVEEGSLARAAARLRRSPPAVTRALAALEGRIGLRLIDRTTRRLAPSEAGRALYDKARGLLADYEAATSDAAEAPVRGLLRLTAPVQFGRRHIAPIVNRFLDVHAGVE